MLKVKYAGHPPNALYCQWEALVIQEAADKGWKAKKKATFSHLAYAVMGEHMDCRCKACKGRGVKNKNPEPGEVVVPGMGRYIIVDCIACNGTGQGKPNQSLRGRLLGMTPSSYQETWHDRFEHLLLELSMIERNSADDFARKMKKR